MASTLSILTFPQRWKNNQLTIRALIIPRNIDPTLDDQIVPGTPAWCNATIALQARLLVDPDEYPDTTKPDNKFPMLGIAMPANTADIFNEMVTQLGGIQSTAKLEKAETHHRTRKYLPES